MTFFTVSFDYELVWGTFEMTQPSYLRTNVLQENKAALELLDANESLGIPAAWGMVGAAIDPAPLSDRIERCRDYGGRMERLRALLAELDEDEVIAATSIPASFHTRLQSSNQEAAGHSYSHGYPEALAGTALAGDFRSLVQTLEQAGHEFPMVYIAPRNRVTNACRELAREWGFSYVRENPHSALYSPAETLLTGRRRTLVRTGRYLDSFFRVDELLTGAGLRGRGYRPPAEATGNFFLRPQLVGLRRGRLHRRRLERFIQQRFEAGQHVHVWTHPHNFGRDVSASVAFYRDCMTMAVGLASEYGVPLVLPSKVNVDGL